MALIVATQTLVGDTQHGSGMKGGSTDVCHLAVTEVFEVARIWKMAADTLFLDMVSAFASITRRLAIPDLPTSEEGWRRHVASLGFTGGETDDIIHSALTIL